MTDIGPRDVQRFAAQWWLVGVIVAVLLGGLIIGGWQAGWWLSNADTTRQAHQVQNNYNTQEGYIQAIGNDVANLDRIVAEIPAASDKGALRAQAIAVADQACLEASYLTGSVSYPQSMHQWIAANCSAGAVSPSSPLMKGTGN